MARFSTSALLAIMVTAAAGCGSAVGQMHVPVVHGDNGVKLPAPPTTAVHVVVDDYHGVKVEDPYQWLEDAKSPATRAWINAENAYTQKYLSQIHKRGQIAAEITRLLRVDRSTTPALVAGKYFFEKRLADENQSSIYVRDGWTGGDRILVNGNTLSRDQNTSANLDDVSQDGKLIVYGVRQGGADEATLHILDVASGKNLPDVLPSARYFGSSIGPDDKGLYYAVFTPAGTNVYYHTLGQPVSTDKKIFGGEYRGQKLGELDLVAAYLSDDGHYLFLSIAHGVPSTRDDILVKDLRRPGSDFVPLVYGVEAHNTALSIGDRFFMQTDYQAPNGRVVELKPGGQPADWKTVVAESKDVIDSFSIVGGKLFVTRLHDVKTETTIYSLAGQVTGQVEYPGIGSGSGMSGRSMDHEGFYSFQSFNLPPTIYRYNVVTGKSEVFAASKVPFDSAAYKVRQVFYTSKDGTRVPMFIVGRKGLKRDGKTRLLMTGYGGFDLAERPYFDATIAWWLEQGGWFALPNLRGGDEYGEAWHKAAMFAHKQNVFDDWAAAAEYLIQSHYTSPQHFAIYGRSNGGLLMGAAMTQHPELFGAIWCGYPLLDMLRYQKFEFGRLWTTEYGNAENAKDFAYIVKYSPYQNVKAGTKYPAIMFWTGDADTRVDPMNARKMTAEVQAEDGGDRPILLHYSLKGGHSAGVSLAQTVADEADMLSFLWNETGPAVQAGAASPQVSGQW
jgi:prolyl oligopeptidase